MEFKNYKKEDLFYCHSLNLFHFLKSNGFYYLYKDRNHDSKFFFWVFERSPLILEALTSYTNNKKSK